MDNPFDSHQGSPPAKAETQWSGREDEPERPRGNGVHRRRSPGFADRRPGPYRGSRGRSRSPGDIDRYQPDDRNGRDDYYGRSREGNREKRRRGETPPMIDRYMPGQEPSIPLVPLVNPLPPPLSMEAQVGFTWFAEWWRTEQKIKEEKERQTSGRRPSSRAGQRDPMEERERERPLIQAAYDAYKQEYLSRTSRMFVLMHKNEEWFKERYVPEVREPQRARLMEYRQEALTRWQHDIDSGVFDNFSLEGIYKNESNGAGGVVEREEGETVAATEVLGVRDLLPSLGADLRDDAALQPALLIKTLAPMVSRDKIVEFAKEQLGEADGGYKWISLSDPNPMKKFHRIGWIMLNPGSDMEPEVDRGDGRDNEEEMADADAPIESKGNLLTVAERALGVVEGKTIHDETRGDFTVHVGIHTAATEPRKKALWDLFSTTERVERDLELAKRLVDKLDQEQGSEANGVAKAEERVELLRTSGMLKPAANGNKKSKAKNDVDEMQDAPEESDEEGEAEEDGMVEDEEDDEDFLAKRKSLDILVEYLRRVYNFCFFCVFETDSVHELCRKCPGGHLRRPKESLTTAQKAAGKASALGEPLPQAQQQRQDSNGEEIGETSPVVEKKYNYRTASRSEQQIHQAFNWVKTYEEKLLQILEPENVDLRKLGGVPHEEGMDEELKKYIKQEDENKFRCKVPECTKLFKAENFWRKHVEKRHEEFYNNIKSDIILVNNYVLDPARIAASRSDASSNGHFPINNQHMQQFTPRNFSLQQMPGMNGFQSYTQPMGFSGFQNFGNHQVQMPGGWMAGGQGMMMGSDAMHGVGPVRRGGGRFQQQRTGPYDRRGPRYGGPGNGRLSPQNRTGGGVPGMMRGGMSARRWDDAPGTQAVGPKEAVQGRSLKSYEDLDAVAGGGGAELNY